MHQIHLSEAAFRAYEKRAKQVGLSVEQYLDQSAPTEDFRLTREMKEGIERAIQQADAGEGMSIEEVDRALEAHKAEWRKSRR